MKNAKLVIVGIVAMATSVLAADTTNAPVAAGFDPLKNLYVNVGFGSQKLESNGNDGQLFQTVGYNMGLQLKQLDNGVVIGLQNGVNATVTERDNDQKGVFNTTSGLFFRNLKLGCNQVAGATLFDFEHTFDGANLWSFRPILGLTVSDKDAIGATASFHINTDNGEQSTPYAAGFWNRTWNDKIASEAKVGYQFGAIKETFGSAQVAYGFNKNVNLVALGEVNGNGDYTAGLAVVYGFGGTGQHSTLANIRGVDATPFPKK